MDFNQWFAAHKRRNPNAKINATTRDLYRAWLKNHPRDPGEGGPGAGRIPSPENGGLPAPPASTPEQSQPQQPAVPAPPPPPAAPRIDARQEQDILNLVNQRNLLPAEYNQQRNTSATNFRTGLLDSGFFDTVGISSQETTTDAQGNPLWRPMEFQTANNPTNAQSQQIRQLVARTPGANEARPEGNITYKFSYGADGKLYRQAFMRNADAFASRGVSGSLVSDAQKQSRQSIDTARDQSMNNYNNTVSAINRNQTTDDTRLTREISTGNVGYQDWSGKQDTALPSLTTGTSPTDVSGTNNVVTPTVPTATASTSTGGNLGTWTTKAAGANATARLTRAVKDKHPGVSFKIVKRGGKYVAVRT